MDPATPAHEAVRSEVERLLASSPAAQALSSEQRQRLTEDMTKVSAFMAPAHAARALEDKQPAPEDQLRQRLAQKPGQVGADFKAGALREGVQQFDELVKKVDFPNFVSGLVQGVFKAVVDASIQQMQAFGELLTATAKTVDQFAQDSISDGMARDHIAQTYPSAVQIDTSGEGPARLKQSEGSDFDVGAQFGLDNIDLSDEDSESKLVAAVKLKMAEDRQRLLSTMVLLGINRIVVTNGHINAKVVFDMRADDEARRRAHAEMHDTRSETSTSFYTFGVPFAAGGGSSSQSHVAQVASAVDDSSESKAQLKAQLSGDVRLAFKSETFPLEKMVDVMALKQLQQKSQPSTARAAPAVSAPPAAAAPGGAK